METKHYMYALIDYINSRPQLKKAVLFLDKRMPLVTTWGFYLTLIYLAVNMDKRVFYVAFIPWLNFFIVSAVRSRLNLKRPFEELEFEPLLPHSPGKACPSRHASSSVIISIAVYYIYPPAGILLGATSVIICLTRVLTGVHYPRDVIWGAAVGAITGYVGFFIIL